MGRHARTIRLGRTLWESAPLEPEIINLMQERCFDDGAFPSLKEVKGAVAHAKNPLEERPAPFAGKTLPTSTLSTTDYGQRLASWLKRFSKRKKRQRVNNFPFSIESRIDCLRSFAWKKKGCSSRKQAQSGQNLSSRSWASATGHLEQAKAR